MRPRSLPTYLTALTLAAGCATKPTAAPSRPPAPPSVSTADTSASDWQRLFPDEGIPAGWHVRNWNDVSQPAPTNAVWLVENGILRGSVPRGTWLVSERVYDDFVLEFECRLGERGNGGVGLRFPPAGDPATAGLEIQIVDPRYYGNNHVGSPWEYTGAIYKAVAPSGQAFRPLDWNHFTITALGSRVSVVVNGQTVCDADLDRPTPPVWPALPLSQRPRRGHLGFQEVSRGGGQVEIRNTRIRLLARDDR